MPLTIHLPLDVEQTLRREVADLDQTAKEVLLVELYRQDRLTQFELSRALGLSRLETESLLKSHNVIEDLISTEEYEAALSHLREQTTK